MDRLKDLALSDVREREVRPLYETGRPKRRPTIPPRKTALRQTRTAGVRGQSEKELILGLSVLVLVAGRGQNQRPSPRFEDSHTWSHTCASTRPSTLAAEVATTADAGREQKNPQSQGTRGAQHESPPRASLRRSKGPPQLRRPRYLTINRLTGCS